MLEEEMNVGTSFFYGGSWIWILFIILLIVIICPFIFRPIAPCY